MEIGDPDVAELGLLVPDVEHVVGCPAPVRLAQADALSDSGDGCEAQPVLRLVRFVLDLDFDHARAPDPCCRRRG